VTIESQVLLFLESNAKKLYQLEDLNLPLTDETKTAIFNLGYKGEIDTYLVKFGKNDTQLLYFSLSLKGEHHV
jgi:hypothetical protein